MSIEKESAFKSGSVSWSSQRIGEGAGEPVRAGHLESPNEKVKLIPERFGPTTSV